MNFEYILKCVEDTKNMAKDIAPFIKNNIIFNDKGKIFYVFFLSNWIY